MVLLSTCSLDAARGKRTATRHLPKFKDLAADAIHGQPGHSVAFNQSTLYRNSGNADLVQNPVGKSRGILRAQNDVNLLTLIGDEDERTARRHTQFCTE